MPQSQPNPSPLSIQELLDRCIDFLSASHVDLRSCSLVARSWVHISQSHLFRSPQLTAQRPGADTTQLTLSAILTSSPHLIHHVRQLHIPFHISRSAPLALDKLCMIKYTHLEEISIHINWRVYVPELLRPSVLSLPTLRWLKLHLSEGRQFLDTVPLFKNLSPTIQHLDLIVGPWEEPETPLRTSESSMVPPPIRLKSLRLELLAEPYDYRGRPMPPLDISVLAPFDVSELKALQLSRLNSVPWHTLPRAKIEILDVVLLEEAMDLSSFPKLTTLRITIPEALKESFRLVLATIPPSSRIRTIVIGIESWPLDEAECSPLDEHLGCLPLSGPVVIEFEIPFPQNEATEEILQSLFPRVVSQTRFRMSYVLLGDVETAKWKMSANWWREQVASL
ncbi:hypothetical protein R3P38DRAFT_1722301 [Favolaschia claudopus]|uniref:F-box domain-containing protein n=1 Tax=Favolaschia claudopus TaxID=2862362 RepID=A0AAW0A9V4_9AGAR